MDNHISYSQVSQYLRCGLAYYFKYRSDREPEFLPAPLVLGSAFHKSAEAYFRSIMNGTPTPGLDELHEVFRKAWENLIDSSPTQIRLKEGEDATQNIDLARRMLEAFLEYVEEREYRVVAVEERFSVDLGNDLPPLVAYFDLVELLPNGDLCITDVKTAGRKYAEGSAFDSLQLAAYASIAKALGHQGVVQVKYLVVTKTKSPAVQELVAVLDEHDIARFTNIAQAVHQGVEREVFVPNPGWMCGSCEWQSACRERLAEVA